MKIEMEEIRALDLVPGDLFIALPPVDAPVEYQEFFRESLAGIEESASVTVILKTDAPWLGAPEEDDLVLRVMVTS